MIETEAKGQTDALTAAEASSLLINHEVSQITDKSNKEGCFPLWIEEDEVGKIELENGNEIRVKTMGNSTV